ncbi:hypothetical protein B2M26_08280 [Ferroacidibacillus organovorans]|uniref:HicB-like antitoxin of toxin-antitoxin system domain-containing protein n=1 Tax=Ferroacidibacillus organovorans TaxID=1765683 RepID=A0A1V4ET79_9BACL|nr:hypothetical protein B2M26_08280 [Ferroacidibacillus organovorans]
MSGDWRVAFVAGCGCCHYVYVKEQKKLAVPYHRPYIKVIYVERAIELLKGGDFPGCLSQGETVEEAVAMIEDAKRGWLEVSLELGHSIPEPTRDLAIAFSGKFNVRVPRTLHKLLVEKAAGEDVSLNQYILYQLSSAVGIQQPRKVSRSSEEPVR